MRLVDKIFILDISAANLVNLSQKQRYNLKKYRIWRELVFITTCIFLLCFSRNDESVFNWMEETVIVLIIEYLTLNVLANILRIFGLFKDG